MTRIVVSVHIPAPPAQVWRRLADLAAHADWMADAERVEFVGGQTRGVGTRMRVHTRVGPLRTVDVMEVVAWDEPRSLAVRHLGAVTGEGRFDLSPAAGGTAVTWTEDLSFPRRLGGALAGFVARPLLRRLWRRNLQRLRLCLDDPSW